MVCNAVSCCETYISGLLPDFLQTMQGRLCYRHHRLLIAPNNNPRMFLLNVTIYFGAERPDSSRPTSPFHNLKFCHFHCRCVQPVKLVSCSPVSRPVSSSHPVPKIVWPGARIFTVAPSFPRPSGGTLSNHRPVTCRWFSLHRARETCTLFLLAESSPCSWCASVVSAQCRS